MADEDDAILTDDDVELPAMEVRVPPDWQSKISARVLTNAEPMADGELLLLATSALERKVGDILNHSGDHTLTLPLIVWEDLVSTHGSHKAAEKVLAAVISGVEAHWATHVSIEVFGELCGMLNADYSEVLVCRVLSLFKQGDNGEPPLVCADELSEVMTSEWGRALEAEAAKAALTQLWLDEGGLSSLTQAVDKIVGRAAGTDTKRVRLDQLLMQLVTVLRSSMGDEAQV